MLLQKVVCLSASAIQACESVGVRTIADFLARDPCKMSQLTNLSLDYIFKIRTIFFTKYCASVSTAANLALKLDNEPISTGLKCVDDQLLDSGGLCTNHIYEIFGLPGSGKTQFCMQMCAQTVLAGKHALYVDTKNDFCQERLSDFLNISYYEKIHLAKVFDLYGILDLLDNLDQNSVPFDARLLIVDNIASLVLPLLDNDNLNEIFAMVAKLIGLFKRLAAQYNLAVVVANNATNKGPALGKMFSGAADTRIEMQKEQDDDGTSNTKRRVSIDKSMSRPKGEECTINLTSHGFQEV